MNVSTKQYEEKGDFVCTATNLPRVKGYSHRKCYTANLYKPKITVCHSFDQQQLHAQNAKISSRNKMWFVLRSSPNLPQSLHPHHMLLMLGMSAGRSELWFSFVSVCF